MAQTNFTPILTYKSDTASSVPSAGNLTNSANGAELAVNTADKRLFTKDSGGNVVEVGTNPSSLTMPNGTANGVVYANGSKVLTSGSGLVFDGARLGLGVTPSSWGTSWKAFDFSNRGGLASGFDETDLNNNVYRINTGAYYYKETAAASTYNQSGGAHVWLTAASGTAGTAITFTQAMTLNASGNLGIGTSSPSSAYSGAARVAMVAATGSTAASIRISSANASAELYSAGSTTDWGLYSASNSPFAIYTNSVRQLVIDSAGNLGLGVTPKAWAGGYLGFQIRDAAFASYTSGFTWVGNNWYSDGSNKYIANGYGTLYEQTAGKHVFYTAGNNVSGAGATMSLTQAMTLTADGDLQVGFTGSSITAGGIASVPNSANSYRAVGHITGSASGSAYDYFLYAGSIIGSITQSGTTAVAYNTSSDYRLKNTIAPMTGALAKVALLKPCTYKWNADGSDGEGFIAHELAEVCPHAVTGEKDAVDEEGNPKYQGIDVSFLVATLTAAIQEQQAIIESLKARLDAANL